MEISLPDEHGRFQILNIHTTRMKEFKKIADDVDMKVNCQYPINLMYQFTYSLHNTINV